MKREIKFRGLTKSGAWAYGMPCKSNYGIEMVTELYHVDGAEWNEYGDDVKPETVGQFTGLKDKNGKDIYEGDIVNGVYETDSDSNATKSELRIVEFGNYSFRLSTASGETKNRLSEYFYFEVIGNIYEHNHLLK